MPLSLAGALASLLLFGQTLNVFSQIGIIMLIGLVTKNGILIVEFANQRKRAGLARARRRCIDAAARAPPPDPDDQRSRRSSASCRSRSRSAAPSGSRQSLGIAVVGGLLFSTVLTLYVVPAVYDALSGLGERTVTEARTVPRRSPPARPA